MSDIPERRVALTLLAHPDDAEFLCAGTLVRLAEAGWEVHIATVAAGDCGSATLPPDEIAAIRRREGIEAASKIGATYHCLEESDVRVIFDKATIDKTIDLFRAVAPTLVFTHARYDYMMDHEQVHLLARTATFSYAIPNASSLPLVAGSIVPWLYYCDSIEALDPYTGNLVKASIIIDVSNQFEKKLQMLTCHASQRAWLQAHHGVDEYVEAVRRFATMRGKQIDAKYGEAFVQHRGHAYPQTDILQDMFGS